MDKQQTPLEQNIPERQKTKVRSSKLLKIGRAFAALFAFFCMISLGLFTYFNYKNIEKTKQVSSLFQKGMQIRNSYDTLSITKVRQGTTFSQFPHRLLEIHADENVMYSYRDDFYKDYSEPDVKIDQSKVVIYLTQRQVFDNPIALAEQPECEAMARIESQKRPPDTYEDNPTEITLKYLDKHASDRKVYIYTPKLGYCKKVFSDSQLLRAQANANSIKYSF